MYYIYLLKKKDYLALFLYSVIGKDVEENSNRGLVFLREKGVETYVVRA